VPLNSSSNLSDQLPGTPLGCTLVLGVACGLDGVGVGLLVGVVVGDGLLDGLDGAVTGVDELGDGLGLTW
jgi:hypothetical protein